jgi:hypothetical protein
VITAFRQPTGWQRLPPDDEIVEIIQRYFSFTRDPFFVVRRRTVGEVVALECGINWWPALGQTIERLITELGAAPIVFCNRRLYKHVAPANLSDEDARKLASELREVKKTRLRPLDVVR